MAFLTLNNENTRLYLQTQPFEAGLVKRISEYTWDFKLNLWTFILSRRKIHEIRKIFEENNSELEIDNSVHLWILEDERKTLLLQTLKTVDKVDLPDGFVPKTILFNHQTVGISFILNMKHGLLLDEQGLGKSIQALYSFIIARDRGEVKRCLVVCPKSLLFNWGQEIEKHLGLEYNIISGSKVKREKLLKSNKCPILITGYDTVRIHKDDGAFRDFVENQFLILDEAAYLKNARSKRTKSIYDMTARYKVMLTGTPVMNRPIDCYSLIQAVRPTWKNFWAFEDRFIVKNWFGGVQSYKNLDELKDRLDRVSLRRLKINCLDLPPKVYEDRVVDMTEEQKKKYDICLNELRLEFSNTDEKDFTKKHMSMLTMLLRLSQISGGLISDGQKMEIIPKTGKLLELDNIIESLPDKKVVVWCNFIGIIKYIHNKYITKSVMLIGDMKPEERSAVITKFKTDPNCQLLVGQVRTGGLGINLPEAQNEVFYDLPMSPGDYQQACDRCHRIGQTGTVSIIHLLSEDSVDIKTRKMLASKVGLISQITGDAPFISTYNETKELIKKD